MRPLALQWTHFTKCAKGLLKRAANFDVSSGDGVMVVVAIVGPPSSSRMGAQKAAMNVTAEGQRAVMVYRAALPRDGRPDSGSSGPTERLRSEFVYRTWTLNNCTTLRRLLMSLLHPSSGRLGRARGPLADYSWPSAVKGAFLRSREILSEL